MSDASHEVRTARGHPAGESEVSAVSHSAAPLGIPGVVWLCCSLSATADTARRGPFYSDELRSAGSTSFAARFFTGELCGLHATRAVAASAKQISLLAISGVLPFARTRPVARMILICWINAVKYTPAGGRVTVSFSLLAFRPRSTR